MTDQQLTEYIKAELSKGLPVRKIQKDLVKNGFDELQVNNILKSLNQAVASLDPTTTNPNQNSQSLASQPTQNDEKTDVVMYEYVGFWIRFLAYSVDMFLVSITIFLFFSLIFLFFYLQLEILAFLTAIAIVPLRYIIPFVYFHHYWSKNGQTPGNRLLAIKVIKVDKNQTALKTSVLRYAGYFISELLLYLPFLIVAFDERKQGLHDMMAKTYVVKTEQSRHLVVALLLGFGVIIIPIIAIFLSIFLIGLNPNKNYDEVKTYENEIDSDNYFQQSDFNEETMQETADVFNSSDTQVNQAQVITPNMYVAYSPATEGDIDNPGFKFTITNANDVTNVSYQVSNSNSNYVKFSGGMNNSYSKPELVKEISFSQSGVCPVDEATCTLENITGDIYVSAELTMKNGQKLTGRKVLTKNPAE